MSGTGVAVTVDASLLVLAFVFLVGVWRITSGPTRADRVLGADLCFFCLVGAVTLLAVRADTPAFVDVVLVATLVGFLATVALARLVDRSTE